MSRHACLRLAAALSFASALLIASHAGAQPQTGSVSGHVIAAATGQPVAGIRVGVLDFTGSGTSLTSAVSDATGLFTIPDLPRRYYDARTWDAAAYGYLDQVYWGVPCDSVCTYAQGLPSR